MEYSFEMDIVKRMAASFFRTWKNVQFTWQLFQTHMCMIYGINKALFRKQRQINKF